MPAGGLGALAAGVEMAKAAAASSGTVAVTAEAAMGMTALHTGVFIAAEYAEYLSYELTGWGAEYVKAVMAGAALDALIHEAQMRLVMQEMGRQMLISDARMVAYARASRSVSLGWSALV